ncbi:phosphoesterase [Achromatium sp. WMS2]|nr:phosphoesterase [Achromatium sp. WMS2]
MYLTYDLHTHSTSSDGILTPSELIIRAAASGVKTLALTDHDTLDGIPEATATAKLQGINFIAGVEISVTWSEKTIHIVGLNIDTSLKLLHTELEKLCEFRNWRAEEIARKLASCNIHNALEGAKALSNGHLISRTHFARFLMHSGFANDENEAFKNFLLPSKPGYVQGQWAELEKAISWITQAGGQAVLAHPTRYNISNKKLRTLIREFKAYGGAAMEVTSGRFGGQERIAMANLAVKFDLLASAGSDFHDPKNIATELGKLPLLPANCTPIWYNWS